MNWYKKAIRMYETFGLDKKLVQSFQRHYEKWLRAQLDTKNPQRLQKWYHQEKQIHIGSANLGDSLNVIFERHGMPQGIDNHIPKRIHFLMLHPSQPNAEGKNAFFYVDYDNNFIIGKTAKDINNVQFDYEFERTIGHELQHFLRSLYEGRAAPSYAYIKDYEGLDYYGDPWEIQTFALRFAADAIDLVKSTYLARIEGMPPERVQEILEKVKGNKSKLATIAIKQTKRHFLSMEDLENKMPEELLKKYYSATVANFNKLFDDMIGEYEQLV